MRSTVIVLVTLGAAIMAACGDGPDGVGVTPPPRQPAPIGSPIPQQGGAFVIPCNQDEYVQTTPRLDYEVKVTNDDNNLVSLSGVQVNACMGLTQQAKRSATVVLGEGLQTWLEATYPKGTTEVSQEEFEAKVCVEVSRLISTQPSLSRVTWVSLATFGTFTMELKPVTGRQPPPPTQGNYSDPGCKLPRVGPTA